MFAGYSVIATVIYLLTGGDAFRRTEVTYPAALLTYFVAGVVGGLSAGALLPLTTTRSGSVMFGIVVAFPVWGCIAWSVDGPAWTWGWGEWFTVAALAVAFGSALGYYEWQPPDRRQGG